VVLRNAPYKRSAGLAESGSGGSGSTHGQRLSDRGHLALQEKPTVNYKPN